ncbi:protein TonB [Dysgonomonadaceae bacterium PH5-43]|nr:protein TonB [Dysgonomonadaceae bacterium PH5-43]
MQSKKNNNVDLERETTTYFLMGLVVALASFFVLIEWRTVEPDMPEWEGLPQIFIEEEYLSEITIPTVEEEKPLQETKSEILYEDFNVVDEAVEEMEEELPETFNYQEETKEKETVQYQETTDEQEEQTITTPDVMPKFPGGNNALSRFLFKNLKYPASAQTQHKQGRVWCSFIVNKDGSTSNYKIEKGIYISLDQETIRVLELMPKWIPGTKNGEPVRVKVYIPVYFKL